jgi:hypothetical protein
MLVDDMAMELRCWNNVAVAEFEVFDEEAGAVKGLLAADAGELLIDLVALVYISECLLE